MKKVLKYSLVCFVIPLVIILGVVLFGYKQYAALSLLVAVITCVPFFISFAAVVIISALYFGAEFGFLTGALSALVSNFYFGQGPWTPFQMFAWGIIGFVAGLLSNPLCRSKILLVMYSAFAGAVYSLIMDVWTTLWADGSFNLNRFLAAVATSLPIMLIYVASNVIFVLILNPLFEKKITRLKNKYKI